MTAPPTETPRKKKRRKKSEAQTEAQTVVRPQRLDGRGLRGAVLVVLVALVAAAEYYDYPIQKQPLVAVLGIITIVALAGAALFQIVRSGPEATLPRPPFAADWPKHPQLEPLLRAFEAGNFGYVREHAARVATDSDDPDVAAAAQELRRRIEPSPTSLYLWGLGVALVVFLYGYFLSHAH